MQSSIDKKKQGKGKLRKALIEQLKEVAHETIETCKQKKLKHA